MLQELIAEAERMAKPSLLLTAASASADVIGWWRGGKPDWHAGRADDTHRISVDARWFSKHGVRVEGVVSIYDVAPHWGWPVPVHVQRMHGGKLPAVAGPGSTLLAGREAPSLPPLEALCLYGGAPVEKWLSSAGLDRTDYDRAAELDVGAEYVRHYMERSPLHMTDVAAVLSGWHAMWPSDDFYVPREMHLVLWTLWDSEPWIEVFERFPNITTRVRIT